MAVLKWADLLDAAQPLLQRLDGGEDLVAGLRGAGQGLLLRELGELRVNLLRFGERVEEARQEGAFLRGDLRGGSVVGNSCGPVRVGQEG